MPTNSPISDSNSDNCGVCMFEQQINSTTTITMHVSAIMRACGMWNSMCVYVIVFKKVFRSDTTSSIGCIGCVGRVCCVIGRVGRVIGCVCCVCRVCRVIGRVIGRVGRVIGGVSRASCTASCFF